MQTCHVMALQTEGAGPSRLKGSSHVAGSGRSGSSDDVGGRRESPSQLSVDKAASSAEVQWYAKYLESHIQTFSQHCDGSDEKSRINLYHTSTWLDWTVNDKSRFFAAVSRHSRLRADLIALDCSKPESEVYIYLDALDKGLNNALVEEESDKPVTNTPSRKKRLRQGKMLAAREVSEDWLKREEELAQTLLQDVLEEERLVEETESATKRHEGRRTIPCGLKAVEDRQERHRQRKKALEDQEIIWEREDWGRALDGTKLDQLNKLTKRSWSEWYRDRVRPSRFALAPSVDPAALDEDVPTAQKGFSKHTKIAIDNATLQSLQAMSKRERTSEQRADLAKLVNRKRNRDNVRMKRLLELGMTEETIEEGGGIDKAFLRSIGQDEDAETAVLAELGDLGRSARPSPVKTSRAKSTSRQASPVNFEAPTVSEEDAGVKHLRHIGLDDYIHARNLDIINFEAIALMKDGPDVSLPMLEILMKKLRAYLRQLILRSVLVAEADAVQADGAAHIESHHIEAALADAEAIVMDVAGSFSRRGPSDPGPETTEIDIEIGYPSETDLQLTEDEDVGIDEAANAMDQTMDMSAERELWRSIGLDKGVTSSEVIETARKGRFVIGQGADVKRTPDL
jgi:hypothetical protein